MNANGLYVPFRGPVGPQGEAPTITGTSTSSVAVGTGSKSFTTQSDIVWELGQRIRAANDDHTAIMEGEITAYSGTTLTLDVDYTVGAGSISQWNLVICGARGATGASGTGLSITQYDVTVANVTQASPDTQTVIASAASTGTLIFWVTVVIENGDPTKTFEAKISPKIAGADVSNAVVYQSDEAGSKKHTIGFSGLGAITATNAFRLHFEQVDAGGGQYNILSGNVLFQIV